MKHIRTAAVLGALALASLPASAAMKLYISDGTHSYSVTDNGLGDIGPSGTIAGKIQFDTTGSALTQGNVSGQFYSKPYLGTPGTLSLSGTTVQSSGAATFTLKFTDTDFSAPVGFPLGLYQQLSATNLTKNTSISVTGYELNSTGGNGEFANSANDPTLNPSAGANAGPTLTCSSLPCGTDGSSGPFTFSAPYSLTEIVTINFLEAGSLTINFTGGLNAVPEPASLGLLFSVVALTGVALHRKVGTV